MDRINKASTIEFPKISAIRNNNGKKKDKNKEISIYFSMWTKVCQLDYRAKVYMYIFIHVLEAFVYVNENVYIYVYMCIYRYIRMRMYVYKYVRICI